MSSNTDNISSINSLRQNDDQYDTPWNIEIWVDNTLVSDPRKRAASIAAIKAGLEAKKADQEAAIRQEFLDAEYNRSQRL
jgi:hypothetical protein